MRHAHLAPALGALLSIGIASVVSAQQAPIDSSTVTSQQDASTGLPSFASLDKKNRGQLSRSDIPKDVEGLKQLRAHFIEADLDHNGHLSPNEYAAYVQSQKPVAEKNPR